MFAMEKYDWSIWKGKEKFALQVNYDRSFEYSISAGCYDYINTDIAKANFQPVESERGRKRKVFSLYHFFGEGIGLDEVVGEIQGDGFYPATPRELLALGENCPELQREFSIVALGSVCFNSDGYRFVAQLWGDSEKRGLDLAWYDGNWFGRCYFLGVRK